MPADAPDEELDLTPEQRFRIDDLFARLEELDDHGILGVPAGTEWGAVRKAYFQRVAEFHPDRFFRKRLGSYRPKMEALSRRVTEAYEALAKGPRVSAPSPAPAAPKPDPAREKALLALKQQLEARHAEARRLAAEAQRAAAHGDLAGSTDLYRRAAALAPKDATIQTAYETSRRSLEATAAEGLVRQAEFEERFEHWAEAARTWQRVVDTRPHDANARERLARALGRAHGASGGGKP